MSNLSVSELEAQVAVDPLNSTLMFALIDQLRGQTPRCEGNHTYLVHNSNFNIAVMHK